MLIFATQNFTSEIKLCLKNKASRIRIVIAAVVSMAILLTLMNSLAIAQSDQKLRLKEFEISVPDQLQQIQHPAAILFLKHKTQEYPTFNSLKGSGEWQHQKLSLSEKARKLEHEYHLVGLKSAQIRKTEELPMGGEMMTYAELEFNSNSEKLLSRVWIKSWDDRHYIFTSIQQLPEKALDTEIINRLISSIIFPAPTASISSPPREPQLEQPSSAYKSGSIIVLIVICLGFFYFRYRR
jgi:hypothetical protein